MPYTINLMEHTAAVIQDALVLLVWIGSIALVKIDFTVILNSKYVSEKKNVLLQKRYKDPLHQISIFSSWTCLVMYHCIVH